RSLGNQPIGSITPGHFGSSSYEFVVAGNRLYALDGNYGNDRWAVTGTPWWMCTCQYSTAQCCQAFGGAIDHEPVLDTPPSDVTYLYITSEDGHLYQLDPGTGTIVRQADLRRPGCPGDRLKGPPVIQRYATSTTNFQNAYGPRDVIYVTTAYDQVNCG